jgi:lipid-A-disaccharide synthase
MQVAIACSGTVTTELAAQGAAVVTGYKVGWITWALLRFFLLKSRFTTLINVAANREVIPEFIQTRFHARNVEQAAERLLTDSKVREAQLKAQQDALRIMAGSGRPAAEIAAETILKLS